MNLISYGTTGNRSPFGGTTRVVLVILLALLTAEATSGQSNPMAYSGTTLYTPAKRFGFFGYSDGEKASRVPPPIEGMESHDVSIQGTQIPLTSSQSVEGNPVHAVAPGDSGNVYSFDTQGVPRYVPQGGGELDISPNDRFSQFMLYPRPIRESLFQGAGADLVYVPDRKEEAAGYYEAGASATLGIPMPANKSVLLISPMFTWTRMSLPDAAKTLFEEKVNLYAPGFRSQFLIPVGNMFMFDFGVSAQWTSDFKYTGDHNLLLAGYGSVVFKMDEVTRLVCGLGYYDAGRYKIMPFGGILWRASECLYLEIMFPKPRISWKLPQSMQNSNDKASYWLYLTGEYNARRWTIFQDFSLPTDLVKAEYRLVSDDIRILAGLEKKSNDCINWAIEGGLIFNRHLDITSRQSGINYQERFRPDPAGIVQMKFRY